MQGASSAQEEGPGGQSREDDGGATEHMLLMALESLYKDATEQDVRLGLLRTTLQILQRHGEHPHKQPSQHHLLALSCSTIPGTRQSESLGDVAEGAIAVSISRKHLQQPRSCERLSSCQHGSSMFQDRDNLTFKAV